MYCLRVPFLETVQSNLRARYLGLVSPGGHKRFAHAGTAQPGHAGGMTTAMSRVTVRMEVGGVSRALARRYCCAGIRRCRLRFELMGPRGTGPARRRRWVPLRQ